MEKEADYGRKCLELFAKQDLAMCLSKTARSFSGKVSTPYYKTFPKQGMMQNGDVYKLGTLISRIKEKESLLLPTPNASDSRVILSKISSIINQFTQKHQDKLLYQCQLNGLTPNQTIEVYECIMGFPKNWTQTE